MSQPSDERSLLDGFRELRERDAATAGDFVCILDLRRARPRIDAGPRLRAVAFAMLGAAAAVVAGVWIAMKPASVPKLDAAALQLACWESPTGFLLATDFSPSKTRQEP